LGEETAENSPLSERAIVVKKLRRPGRSVGWGEGAGSQEGLTKRRRKVGRQMVQLQYKVKLFSRRILVREIRER